ncbi:hypothetical protein K504DRAFT_506536 [Pleomassaria siparia CBS 279.74]|uniref:DUF6594 domain-containing protein n=1 Tax=Pleomassaria siparia CBS 279.74 TaxID=1314801 RepID=A0A6G1JWS9_9PLEO|nr:hypothetical protein K504DRAFT_506536 [Pleomassaria siparia CBS 279.74]
MSTQVRIDMHSLRELDVTWRSDRGAIKGITYPDSIAATFTTPITSGLCSPAITCQPSPFAASYPIELQSFATPRPIPPSQPLTGDAKKQFDEEKKKAAWKYEGYREFSRWMASDDDFFIIRRFQSLNANVILYMQDRIPQIEERLAEIHMNNENAPDVEKRRNNSFRWDMKHEVERDKLLCELTSLLHHYNQYVDTFSKIRERPRADKSQVTNLHEFINRNAITKKETDFAEHRPDLISINAHRSSPLGRFLETIRVIRLSSLVRAKPDPDSQVISNYTHYASDDALATLTTISIVLIGLIMLLGPLWLLEFVPGSKKRLLTITIFITVFMALMSTATINRPFEVVASSAAYAAVLMVFMQIDANA